MLRRARIEKIIANNERNKYFTALITWLDRDGGFYNEASITAKISLSYGYISRSFGIQYYPVPGDIVLCGFCEDENPVIIAFLSSEYYSKVIKKNKLNYYFRNIVEGEYTIKGLRGNEMYLDRKGSLKFIARDQQIEYQLQADKTMVLNQDNYIRKLKHEDKNDPVKGTVVDLEKQVADYPKTEVTIGQVYDDKYETEELLNGESLAVKVVGYTNNAETDDNGNIDVTTEQTYSLKINTQGELSLARTDGKYNISIDKDGNISLSGTKITISADDILVGDNNTEPAVKGTTLQQWCNSHTHTNGNNGSPTGPSIQTLPSKALSTTVKVQ